MISTSDFKTGMTIEYQNNIYSIIDFQHVKPGKGQAYVRTRLRNLRTGALIDFTFNAGEKMEQAMIEKKKMQYLYRDGLFYIFMDMETYEQLQVDKDTIGEKVVYMLEGMEVIAVSYMGELLEIQLPEKVVLEVVETAPGVKGNTAANATKDAKLETGIHISVPLFVNEGDKVVVSTIDGKYSSRA